MKIIINRSFGGFGFSDEAISLGKAMGSNLDRTCPIMIKLLEDHGSEFMSEPCAKLKVIEIPDGIEYTVEQYDGMEWIAEVHRTWR